MYSFFPFPQSFSQHKTILTITFPCNRSSFFLSITPSSNWMFSSSFFYNTVYSTLLNHFLVLSDSKTLPPMDILPIVSADIVSCTNNFEPLSKHKSQNIKNILNVSLLFNCCLLKLRLSMLLLWYFDISIEAKSFYSTIELSPQQFDNHPLLIWIGSISKQIGFS